VLMYVAVDKYWTPRHSTAVQPLTQPTQEPKAVTAAAPTRDLKIIAVLPFDNLSGRSEDAYLADGLQAEVLNTLARLRELSVISRTSTLEYKGKAHNVRDIGYRLGAGAILEGSIRRYGSKLRLSVQLVDTNNDRPLLAVNYDRDLGHLLDLQSTVARQVADSLVATLSRSQRDNLERVGTNNGDAYDLYLKAMAHLDHPLELTDESYDVREPKRLLEAAVKLDPGYADAYAYLSVLNTVSFSFYDRRPENAVAARHAYERAFEIEPSLPEARLARGVYATYVAKDPAQALDDLQVVVGSRPNSALAHAMLGWTLRRLGRMDEGLAHLLRAYDLDPLNKFYALQPWLTLVGLRRWPEANELSEIGLRRFPDGGWYYLYRPWIEYLARNDVEPMRVALREHGGQLNAQARAILEFEIAVAEGRFLDAIRLQNIAWPPDRSDARDAYAHRVRPSVGILSIGILYYAAGDERRARQSFLAAERFALESHEPGSDEGLAVAQSMLGKHAEALATIDKMRAELFPESGDATNGPETSFVRSIILVRGGHRDEAYAEVNRLLRVPFGAPRWQFWFIPCVVLLVKDDPHFEELLYRPPRL